MGTDIHGVVEHRTPDGKWIATRTLDFVIDEDGNDRWPAARERNYVRCAALADVRGDGPAPRGLPDNASDTVRLLFERDGFDDPSWLPMDEAPRIFATTDPKEPFGRARTAGLLVRQLTETARDGPSWPVPRGAPSLAGTPGTVPSPKQREARTRPHHDPPGTAQRLRARIRSLYEDDAPWARHARDVLLALDMGILLFVVATSFLPPVAWLEVVDTVLGLVLLAEFAARLLAARSLRSELLQPWTWVDAVAIASFLAPVAGEAFGFLRALRLLRVLRLYRVVDRLREVSGMFRSNEEACLAAANLLVFIFVMTGLVYATQHRSNPHITDYADALYFTITSLTTTGFGDITLPGTLGRMISVVIMLAGVTLFLRLAQTMFRPSKVRFDCPTCRLQRHEPDAVHCKACGTVLQIPNEGED